MSELSAAALAVEKDRLLEGGRTPEQVERGQWAMSAEPEVWVVQMHYDYEGEDVRAICISREAAVREGAALARQYVGPLEPLTVIRDEPGGWRCYAGGGEVWVDPWTLSPPEKPQGVHAPQLQTPPKETTNHACGALYGVRCDSCGATP